MSLIIKSDQSGSLTRHADFPSKFVVSRHVDVWQPPERLAGSTVRLPVIYAHDGQNLFLPQFSNTGVDWGIDEALVRLMENYGCQGVLVVGSWCSGMRWPEYMPASPLEELQNAGLRQRFIEEQGSAPLSEDYLRFLVDELKPFIDDHYPTLPGQQDTFIMGASMGGLISLYALCEYPDVFGGAGCLSSHWSVAGSPLVEYFASALPAPGQHRLYFDYGTLGLDADYQPFQTEMDRRLQAAGRQFGRDWVTYRFDGADHNEASWRMRVEIPLAFLLANR